MKAGRKESSEINFLLVSNFHTCAAAKLKQKEKNLISQFVSNYLDKTLIIDPTTVSHRDNPRSVVQKYKQIFSLAHFILNHSFTFRNYIHCCKASN